MRLGVFHWPGEVAKSKYYVNQHGRLFNHLAVRGKREDLTESIRTVSPGHIQCGRSIPKAPRHRLHRPPPDSPLRFQCIHGGDNGGIA